MLNYGFESEGKRITVLNKPDRIRMTPLEDKYMSIGEGRNDNIIFRIKGHKVDMSIHGGIEIEVLNKERPSYKFVNGREYIRKKGDIEFKDWCNNDTFDFGQQISFNHQANGIISCDKKRINLCNYIYDDCKYHYGLCIENGKKICYIGFNDITYEFEFSERNIFNHLVKATNICIPRRGWEWYLNSSERIKFIHKKNPSSNPKNLAVNKL